ncbi:MAG: entericidin A [Phycisphaeraceae bacterium]|nr:entericidin A [Phycisphaeraceae bacterium]
MLTLVVLVIGAGALASCSTTEGFGNDVKHLGGSIEDSAAKNK